MEEGGRAGAELGIFCSSSFHGKTIHFITETCAVVEVKEVITIADSRCEMEVFEQGQGRWIRT